VGDDVATSGQNGKLIPCPSCGGALWVDWHRTELVKQPQTLAIRCGDCCFRQIKLAPSNVEHESGLYWLVDDLQCRVCSHTFTALFTTEADDTALECENCHHMAAEVMDDCCDDDADDDPAVPVGV
jgi:hypothetical protein